MGSPRHYVPRDARSGLDGLPHPSPRLG